MNERELTVVSGLFQISFNLSSPTLSTYNQQLWLTCKVQLDQTAGKSDFIYFGFNLYYDNII